MPAQVQALSGRLRGTSSVCSRPLGLSALSLPPPGRPAPRKTWSPARSQEQPTGRADQIFADAPRAPHRREALDLAPSVHGGAASWSVEPSLPDGIVLDTGSGRIAGAPKAQTQERSYTVTASNEAKRRGAEPAPRCPPGCWPCDFPVSATALHDISCSFSLSLSLSVAEILRKAAEAVRNRSDNSRQDDVPPRPLDHRSEFARRRLPGAMLEQISHGRRSRPKWAELCGFGPPAQRSLPIWARSRPKLAQTWPKFGCPPCHTIGDTCRHPQSKRSEHDVILSDARFFLIRSPLTSLQGRKVVDQTNTEASQIVLREWRVPLPEHSLTVAFLQCSLLLSKAAISHEEAPPELFASIFQASHGPQTAGRMAWDPNHLRCGTHLVPRAPVGHFELFEADFVRSYPHPNFGGPSFHPPPGEDLEQRAASWAPASSDSGLAQHLGRWGHRSKRGKVAGGACFDHAADVPGPRGLAGSAHDKTRPEGPPSSSPSRSSAPRLKALVVLSGDLSEGQIRVLAAIEAPAIQRGGRRCASAPGGGPSGRHRPSPPQATASPQATRSPRHGPSGRRRPP